MTATVIDGATVAAELRHELAGRVRLLQARGVTPGLAVVFIGEDAASAVYVRGKTRACTELGVHSETVRPDPAISQAELLALIGRLNAEPRFHGILVQFPLPPHLDRHAIIAAVDPHKDVDGLHPLNVGLLEQGRGVLLPCTPAGVQQLLVRSGHDPSGKHVVVCGRSNLVGKPLASLLMQKGEGANATVTVCHTGTRDLAACTRTAEILVASMGSPHAITADMVMPGAVVIDVGVNRVPDLSRKSGFRLTGDVDYAAVAEVAGAITPVPGGVGPMTIAMLVANTVVAAEASCGRGA